MSFSWTPHRFAGGALALDVANSVVLRHDAARRIDRFAVQGQMQDFPRAAAEFCAERALFGDIAPVASEDETDFLALREAIDRYFRKRILDGGDDQLLAVLLELCWQKCCARQTPAAWPGPQPIRCCGWSPCRIRSA